MYNYRHDLRQQEVASELAAYKLLLTHFHNLHTAAAEGVFEVTIRSQNQTITLPVDMVVGAQFANDLSEALEDRIVKLEIDLNATIENAGQDIRGERKEIELRDQRHENNLRQVQQQLAQQAATHVTQAPAQRVGRPRKATMEAVGEMAAQVPMNGSTANAVARATNLPSA